MKREVHGNTRKGMEKVGGQRVQIPFGEGGREKEGGTQRDGQISSLAWYDLISAGRRPLKTALYNPFTFRPTPSTFPAPRKTGVAFFRRRLSPVAWKITGFEASLSLTR